MAKPDKPASRSDFEIALVCVLTVESNAVEAIFDEVWKGDDSYGKSADDTNSYTTGRIGHHNVVLVYTSSIGKSAAASAAASLRSSFPRIRLGLLVGICGGAPTSTQGNDIFLGDVIISTGIIQYDFGRQYPNKLIRQDTPEDSLGRPNPEIRSFLRKLEADQSRDLLKDYTTKYGIELCQGRKIDHPAAHEDVLHPSTYRHKHQDGSCEICSKCQSDQDDVCEAPLNLSCDKIKCDKAQVSRKRLGQGRESAYAESDVTFQAPNIHLGRVASGDSVIKSGTRRDEMIKKDRVIAFEMEAAGMWDSIPTIMIKSVCDYADSHKNKKWQRYTAAVAAACAKAFLEQWSTKDRISQPISYRQKPFWNVPITRNTHFVGRVPQLEKLEKELLVRDRAAKAAITGLGGVGKTQIALELAYRRREQSPECSVIWISATNMDVINQSYLDIVKRLQIPGWSDGQSDKKVLLQQYLSQDSAGHWLLIFDNADDIDMWVNKDQAGLTLRSYLPSSNRGHILFTTRDRKTGVSLADPDVLTIGEVDEEMGIELLRTRLMNKGLINERQDTLELLSACTHLPLAIVQAAAYINMNGIAFSQYISLLAEQEQNVIDLLSEEFEEGRKPVAATWLISFERIQNRNVLAAEYLSFMACVQPKAVPLSLLPPAPSQKEFTDAIGLLDAYSFVTRTDADRSLDLHRLVHLATRNWLQRGGNRSSWTARAIKRLNVVIPWCFYDDIMGWRLHSPHAQYVFRSDSETNETEAGVRLRLRVAHGLLSERRLNEAERLFVETWDISSRVCGVNHENTFFSMDGLARTYNPQRRVEEAEELAERTVGMTGRVLGNKADLTLACELTLLEVYIRQKRLDEAESLGKQIIDMSTQVLGNESTTRLYAMLRLADVYHLQRRFEEVEGLLKQNSSSEKLQPTGMGRFAIFRRARLYSEQGQLKEAEELFMQVLDVEKQILGQDHLDTLTTLWSLARTLESQGRIDEAISLVEEVAMKWVQRSGADHPIAVEYCDRLAKRRDAVSLPAPSNMFEALTEEPD
ncbi:MAG: hypothetical protein M1821_003231 [Bathelium mastoideum]|nr:MAG: hypothetical protein M1821_003231 [Bathelium mastoideum]KAI9689415.1 MAG: hypothetical protein M1822_010066 [Bathelium mastoideum]